MSRKLILILIFISIFFSSCTFIDSEAGIVETPTLKKTAVDGKWVITKSIFFDNVFENSFEYKDWVGNDVIFMAQGVAIGKYYSKDVNYEIRRVEPNNYISENYNIDANKLNIDTNYIYLIDINTENETIEIIKVSEDIGYIVMDDAFLQITKVSSSITEDEFDAYIFRIDDENI